eukprot:2681755-Rhodomonas_salina.2
MCHAERQAFRQLFLGFEGGFWLPLQTDAQCEMAAAMVALCVDNAADDDHWIREAGAMEQQTEQHMLESSSEEEEDTQAAADEN